MTTRSTWQLLITTLVMLMCLPTGAHAGVLLGLGDILAAEPATGSISVIDSVTGGKTVIAAGRLLTPEHKAVGVAFAPDDDIIVVHRPAGLSVSAGSSPVRRRCAACHAPASAPVADV
jgi:hypothetical protein